MKHRSEITIWNKTHFKPRMAREVLKTCQRWDAGHYKDMLHVSSCGRILRIVESL